MKKGEEKEPGEIREKEKDACPVGQVILLLFVSRPA